MSDYIKREDAYNLLREKWKAAESREDIFEADTVRQDAVEISNLPTVDAVEVVRCKDCKYQHKLGGRSGWCDRAVVDAGDYVKGIVSANDDDYCSDAERKGK